VTAEQGDIPLHLQEIVSAGGRSSMLVVDSSLEQPRLFIITAQTFLKFQDCLDHGPIGMLVNDPPYHHLFTSVPKEDTLPANLVTLPCRTALP
jgi:hypothetical protein